MCMRKTNLSFWIRISMITNWSINKGVALPSQLARAAEDGVSSFLLGSAINILIRSSTSGCTVNVATNSAILMKEPELDLETMSHYHVTAH